MVSHINDIGSLALFLNILHINLLLVIVTINCMRKSAFPVRTRGGRSDQLAQVMCSGKSRRSGKQPFEPRSKQHGIQRVYQTTEACEAVLYSISITNKLRDIGQKSRHNLLLPTGNRPPGSGDPNHSKVWLWPFYCSFEVEGVVIFVVNSQEAQLIQTFDAFLRV